MVNFQYYSLVRQYLNSCSELGKYLVYNFINIKPYLFEHL